MRYRGGSLDDAYRLASTGMGSKMSRLDIVLLVVGVMGVVAAALLTANDLGWEPLRYIVGIAGAVLIFWAGRNVAHMSG